MDTPRKRSKGFDSSALTAGLKSATGADKSLLQNDLWGSTNSCTPSPSVTGSRRRKSGQPKRLINSSTMNALQPENSYKPYVEPPEVPPLKLIVSTDSDLRSFDEPQYSAAEISGSAHGTTGLDPDYLPQDLGEAPGLFGQTQSAVDTTFTLSQVPAEDELQSPPRTGKKRRRKRNADPAGAEGTPVKRRKKKRPSSTADEQLPEPPSEDPVLVEDSLPVDSEDPAAVNGNIFDWADESMASTGDAVISTPMPGKRRRKKLRVAAAESDDVLVEDSLPQDSPDVTTAMPVELTGTADDVSRSESVTSPPEDTPRKRRKKRRRAAPLADLHDVPAAAAAAVVANDDVADENQVLVEDSIPPGSADDTADSFNTVHNTSTASFGETTTIDASYESEDMFGSQPVAEGLPASPMKKLKQRRQRQKSHQSSDSEPSKQQLPEAADAKSSKKKKRSVRRNSIEKTDALATGTAATNKQNSVASLHSASTDDQVLVEDSVPPHSADDTADSFNDVLNTSTASFGETTAIDASYESEDMFSSQPVAEGLPASPTKKLKQRRQRQKKHQAPLQSSDDEPTEQESTAAGAKSPKKKKKKGKLLRVKSTVQGTNTQDSASVTSEEEMSLLSGVVGDAQELDASIASKSPRQKTRVKRSQQATCAGRRDGEQSAANNPGESAEKARGRQGSTSSNASSRSDDSDTDYQVEATQESTGAGDDDDHDGNGGDHPVSDADTRAQRKQKPSKQRIVPRAAHRRSRAAAASSGNVGLRNLPADSTVTATPVARRSGRRRNRHTGVTPLLSSLTVGGDSDQEETDSAGSMDDDEDAGTVSNNPQLCSDSAAASANPVKHRKALPSAEVITDSDDSDSDQWPSTFASQEHAASPQKKHGRKHSMQKTSALKTRDVESKKLLGIKASLDRNLSLPQTGSITPKFDPHLAPGARQWATNTKKSKDDFEVAGVPQRTGPWSVEEIHILDSNVNAYMERNRDANLTDLIFSFEKRERKGFYVEMAQGIRRPLNSIYTFMKRHNVPALKTGRYSTAEEQQLLKLYDRYGARWARIGHLMNRAPEPLCMKYRALIDRQRAQENGGAKRGRWHDEERRALVAAVREISGVPRGPVDVSLCWSSVSRRVPGRTAEQCRRQWVTQLGMAGDPLGWAQDERAHMIQVICSCDEKIIDGEIPWQDLQRQHWPDIPLPVLQHQWTEIRRQVPDHLSKTLQEVLQSLVDL